MIFQTSVKLNVDGKDIHVVFDMDTGLIGFTEVTGGDYTEYSYQSAPPEFRIAFAKFMEGLAGKTHQNNVLICRKGEAAQVLREFWQSKSGT